MSFTLDWEDHGVYKKFSGVVSFSEYARSQELVFGSPRTDDLHYVINDFLDIQDYAVTTDEAEYAAAITRGASQSNARLRVAYVTQDVKLIMLIERVSVLSFYPLKTFSSLENARAWISANA